MQRSMRTRAAFSSLGTFWRVSTVSPVMVGAAAALVVACGAGRSRTEAPEITTHKAALTQTVTIDPNGYSGSICVVTVGCANLGAVGSFTMNDGTYNISLLYTAATTPPYLSIMPPSGGSPTNVGTVTQDADGTLILDPAASTFFTCTVDGAGRCVVSGPRLTVRPEMLVPVTFDNSNTTVYLSVVGPGQLHATNAKRLMRNRAYRLVDPNITVHPTSFHSSYSSHTDLVVLREADETGQGPLKLIDGTDAAALFRTQQTAGGWRFVVPPENVVQVSYLSGGSPIIAGLRFSHVLDASPKPVLRNRRYRLVHSYSSHPTWGTFFYDKGDFLAKRSVTTGEDIIELHPDSDAYDYFVPGHRSVSPAGPAGPEISIDTAKLVPVTYDARGSSLPLQLYGVHTFTGPTVYNPPATTGVTANLLPGRRYHVMSWNASVHSQTGSIPFHPTWYSATDDLAVSLTGEVSMVAGTEAADRFFALPGAGTFAPKLTRFVVSPGAGYTGTICMYISPQASLGWHCGPPGGALGTLVVPGRRYYIPTANKYVDVNLDGSCMGGVLTPTTFSVSCEVLPTHLLASVSNWNSAANTGTATLTWRHSAAQPAFQIQRAAGADWTTIAMPTITGGPTNWSFSEPIGQGTYTYRVAVPNVAGEPGEYAISNTLVVAEPGDTIITATVPAPDRVHVSWTALTNVTTATLSRAEGAGSQSFTTITTVPPLGAGSYTDVSVTGGSIYKYRLTYGNSLETKTATSEEIRAGEISPETLIEPLLTCVIERSGTYTAVFGYRNTSTQNLNVPAVSPRNFASPGAIDQGQPSWFKAFTAAEPTQPVAFAVSLAQNLEAIWTLGTRSVRAARAVTGSCTLNENGTDGPAIVIGGREYTLAYDRGRIATAAESATDLIPGPSLSTPGGLVGSLDVTSDGAAAYRLPIEVPPGRLGMQPDIALTYSSRQSNGLVGVGWNISGLSEIAPCRTNLRQDSALAAIQFSGSDPLCMDGQRLIKVTDASPSLQADGTEEYRLEHDRGLRIFARTLQNGVPRWFEAHQRNGRKLRFGVHPEYVGGTGDAAGQLGRARRFAADPATGQPLENLALVTVAWPLTEIRDRFDNLVTVAYQVFGASETYEHRPYEITYTGRPGTPGRRIVRFRYEHRVLGASRFDVPSFDAVQRFFAGVGFNVRERLSRIELLAPRYEQNGPGTSELIGSYGLSYEASPMSGRSRLKSIARCDGDGVCLAPVKFTYTDGYKEKNATTGAPVFTAPFSGTLTNIGDVSALYDDRGKHARILVGDVNADGRDDIAWTYRAPDTSNQNRPTTFLRFALATPGSLSPFGSVHTVPPHVKDVRSLQDVDGDGMADIVSRDGVFLNRVRDGGRHFDHQTFPDIVGVSDVRFSDLNGDRRPDAIFWGSITLSLVVAGGKTCAAIPFLTAPGTTRTAFERVPCAGGRSLFRARPVSSHVGRSNSVPVRARGLATLPSSSIWTATDESTRWTTTILAGSKIAPRRTRAGHTCSPEPAPRGR